MLLMLQFSESLITGILSILFIVLACIVIGLCSTTKPETIRKDTTQENYRIEVSKPTSATKIERPRLPRYPETEPTKRPIPGVSYSVREIQRPLVLDEKKVKVLRGGEFVGNRMRYKVKIVNETPYMITDVTVYLLSYPKKALRLAGNEKDCQFPKIEPGGFRSPTFDFLPTQDCVRGDIVAGISYINMTGKAHTLATEPFVIRAVCDLLTPDQVTPEDFALKLKSLEHGEIIIKVDEWTPEEMFDKALRIIDESNFFEVSSKLDFNNKVAFGKITGFAKGKYTKKRVGVQISITGPSQKKGASCTIEVSGEDQAMILPAIDDLKERLNAWLCPMCSSPLTLVNVEDLKAGKVILCPFCGVSIGR
jgi:hypothetical protein